MINDSLADFQEVWIHLKNKVAGTDVYRIEVPSSLLRMVFDPLESRGADQTWSDFLQREIRLLGTMCVEGYMEKMREIAGTRYKRPAWVLTSVDSIEERDTGVVLHGHVEGFRPGPVELKKLE